MENGTVRILNVATGSHIELRGPKDLFAGGDAWCGLNHWTIIISCDGKRILTYSQDNSWFFGPEKEIEERKKKRDECAYLRQARLWDAESGREIKVLEHNAIVRHIAFSSDSQKLLTSADDDVVKCWNAKNGELLFNIQHSGHRPDPSFGPNDTIVVTCWDDKVTRLWDSTTGTLKLTLEGGRNVEFISASKMILGGTWDQTYMWTEDGTLRTKWSGYYVALSPDKKRLALHIEDRRTAIWDTATLTQIKEINGVFVGFDADNEPIIHDHKRMIWLKSPMAVRRFNSSGGGVYLRDPDFPEEGGDGHVIWCPVQLSDDARHCASFLDTGPEVWASKDCENRFKLGVVNKSDEPFLGSRESIHFLDDYRIVALGDKNMVALWTYQHPIGRYGLLWLSEFWTTLVLVAALGWSFWRDHWELRRRANHALPVPSL